MPWEREREAKLVEGPATSRSFSGVLDDGEDVGEDGSEGFLGVDLAAAAVLYDEEGKRREDQQSSRETQR